MIYFDSENKIYLVKPSRVPDYRFTEPFWTNSDHVSTSFWFKEMVVEIPTPDYDLICHELRTIYVDENGKIFMKKWNDDKIYFEDRVNRAFQNYMADLILLEGK